MKTIQLRNGQFKNGTDASFRDLIQLALDTVDPQTGLTYKDFKERGRIEEAMTFKSIIETDGEAKAKNSFMIEDYDLEILKRLVNEVKLGIRDPFIFEFIEYIDKL